MADTSSPHHSDRQMDSEKGSPSATPPESTETVIILMESLIVAYIGTEIKLPQKREREVSLEPATTPRLQVDDASIRFDHARTPAKKNRIHLDSTREEEDGSRSRSPSPTMLGTSPPQEIKIKVRQISQGVEDLSWRNMKAMAEVEEVDMDAEVSEQTVPESVVDNGTTHVDPNGAEHVLPTPPSEPLQSTSTHQSPAPQPAELSDLGASDVPPQDIKDGAKSSDVDETEDPKGVKRKFFQRGTSQGPQEAGTTPNHSSVVEPVKRARDESDKVDNNPREAKRPSPPPEKPASTSVSTPKFGGFMSYASTSSPFASVKGKSLFTAGASRFPPASPSPTPSPFPTTPTHSSATPATKRSGFEAFASSSSPFTAAARAKSPGLGSSSKLGRSKSPTRRANAAHSSAFSAYASSGIQAFAPTPKRARADSPIVNGSSKASSSEPSEKDSGNEDEKDTKDEGQLTFGERLRATTGDEDAAQSEDEEAKLVLSEQDVVTGEEDETTVHQVRAKLFSLAENSWKERGTGTLKLLYRDDDDKSSSRIVMRKEAVFTVILNVTLFHGIRFSIAQDPRYLRFSSIEDGNTIHYNLRLPSAKVAEELLQVITTHIPPA
ncbi:hypothetical protein ONZ45_g6211 [Pleurotus djamor]|nr:hypothetical protein ONZ45_g6211 [Pleurotus djamor]